MGGSLLSLVEIFYHFVLKRCFNKSHPVEIDDDVENDANEQSKLNTGKDK